MKKLGIYIHIPFCLSKCPYCDFYSVPCGIKGIDESIKEKFISALLSEIYDFSCKKGKDYVVDTIYFGGGTPNLLNNHDISRIFDHIYRHFNVENEEIIEKTMEFNPKIWNFGDKIEEFNRISIGSQSFNDEILLKLGRIHKTEDTIKSYEMVKESVSNISLDLMFGIPGETKESFLDSLRKAISLEPKHISLYSLEFMEGTKFYNLREEGKLIETDAELDREIYHEAVKLLEENGYVQYEISNFAKAGYESKHNMKYWNMDEYIGFGPSAHSFIDNSRFSNVSDLSEYIANPFKKGIYEVLSAKDTVSEYTFTALRRVKGIDLNEFRNRFGTKFFEYYKDIIPEWNKFKEDGYVIEEDDNIRLTLEGFDISNRILSLFV